METSSSTISVGDGSIQSMSARVDMTDPDNFKQDQWDMIIRKNSLLHGFTVDANTGEISRARKPGQLTPTRICNLKPFQLKKSAFESKDPPFYIIDNSTIAVVEVQNQLQMSSMQHALNARDVEVALGASFPNAADVGVSVSFERGASTSASRSTATTSSKLHASYDFPRIGVHLDENDLELTQDCKKIWEKLTCAIEELPRKPTNSHYHSSREDLRDLVWKFLETYGYLFSKEVRIGGQMQCTCSACQVQGEDMDEKADTLKSAAAAKFAGPGASIGASFANSKETGSSEKGSNSASVQNLVWEARGGDTTLVSDPASWVLTVKDPLNWRVIKRLRLEGVYRLVGRVTDSPTAVRTFSNFMPDFNFGQLEEASPVRGTAAAYETKTETKIQQLAEPETAPPAKAQRRRRLFGKWPNGEKEQPK